MLNDLISGNIFSRSLGSLRHSGTSSSKRTSKAMEGKLKGKKADVTDNPQTVEGQKSQDTTDRSSSRQGPTKDHEQLDNKSEAKHSKAVEKSIPGANTEVQQKGASKDAGADAKKPQDNDSTNKEEQTQPEGNSSGKPSSRKSDNDTGINSDTKESIDVNNKSTNEKPPKLQAKGIKREADSKSDEGEKRQGLNPDMDTYIKLRNSLRTSVKRKTKLDTELEKIEDDLHEKEEVYLQEASAGNVAKGFDQYTKSQNRRKSILSDQDRIFSQSSTTFDAEL